MGTNDKTNHIPLGLISSVTNTEFYGAWNLIITEILTQDPTTQIVLITPPQRNTQNTPNTEGLILIDYVNAIIDIGQKYGIPVYNWYDKGRLNALTFTTYTDDGTHPNNLGHFIGGYGMGNFIKNN